MNVFKALLRTYGCILAITVIFIELDSSLLRTFVVFQNWKSRYHSSTAALTIPVISLMYPHRGLYYVFVGVLLAAEEDRSTYPSAMLAQYIFYSSQLCIIFGVLYTLMVLSSSFVLVTVSLRV